MPAGKSSLALHLRALCRQVLPLGSVLQLRVYWQLLRHREENVRNHIWRLVKYEGQKSWRASGREISEMTDSGDWYSDGIESQRGGESRGACTCDPLREIVEEDLLPGLSEIER